MIIRKLNIMYKNVYFIKKKLKLNKILKIKIRFFNNNIFISFLEQKNNQFYLLKQYSLFQSGLFKNKLLLSTFLLKEILRKSLFTFFKKYYYLQNYNIILYILYTNISSDLIYNIVQFFKKYSLQSVVLNSCRAHNGCRQKKTQRKKTRVIIL